MYNDFYQFNENPFNVTADPLFFFFSEHHSEAYSHLVFGIKQRKGIIVITGEIGTGKTTLCRTLLHRLDNDVKAALVLNPNFSSIQLLQLILKDLGIETKSKNKFALITALNDFLLKQTAKGNNVAIIIDEAQNLGVKQLEQIRLLSNLETEKEKLLQIILIGQPELCEKLKLNSLRQLNQRVIVRYHILPLSREETKNYIKHRLQIVQGSSDQSQFDIFEQEALDAIYDISGGTPRMINIICDRALLAGFGSEKKTINKNTIYTCTREVIRQ